MGAWGAGLFENDGALDWVGDLMESDAGWALIRKTLSAAGDEDLEDEGASEGEAILAAAECVAVARGKPSAKPNADVLQWCKDHPLKDAGPLAAQALKAVQWVRTSSELKDLWEEADDKEWDGVAADLEKRLL